MSHRHSPCRQEAPRHPRRPVVSMAAVALECEILAQSWRRMAPSHPSRFRPPLERASKARLSPLIRSSTLAHQDTAIALRISIRSKSRPCSEQLKEEINLQCTVSAGDRIRRTTRDMFWARSRMFGGRSLRKCNCGATSQETHSDPGCQRPLDDLQNRPLLQNSSAAAAFAQALASTLRGLHLFRVINRRSRLPTLQLRVRRLRSGLSRTRPHLIKTTVIPGSKVGYQNSLGMFSLHVVCAWRYLYDESHFDLYDIRCTSIVSSRFNQRNAARLKLAHLLTAATFKFWHYFQANSTRS